MYPPVTTQHDIRSSRIMNSRSHRFHPYPVVQQLPSSHGSIHDEMRRVLLSNVDMYYYYWLCRNVYPRHYFHLHTSLYTMPPLSPSLSSSNMYPTRSTVTRNSSDISPMSMRATSSHPYTSNHHHVYPQRLLHPPTWTSHTDRDRQAMVMAMTSTSTYPDSTRNVGPDTLLSTTTTTEDMKTNPFLEQKSSPISHDNTNKKKNCLSITNPEKEPPDHEMIHTKKKNIDEGSTTCAICLDEKKCILFLPCCHMSCCKKCAFHPSLSRICPMCRCFIRGYKIVYW